MAQKLVLQKIFEPAVGDDFQLCFIFRKPGTSRKLAISKLFSQHETAQVTIQKLRQLANVLEMEINKEEDNNPFENSYDWIRLV